MTSGQVHKFLSIEWVNKTQIALVIWQDEIAAGSLDTNTAKQRLLYRIKKKANFTEAERKRVENEIEKILIKIQNYS